MSISTPKPVQGQVDPYVFENGFYLHTRPERMAKLLASYECYRRIANLPGAIVEAGVFKGASLFRWAKFRAVLEHAAARPIFGFDVFGEFPQATGEDRAHASAFTADAGSCGTSRSELEAMLDELGVGENVELVEGDVLETIPRFVEDNPHLRIALLHVDVDLYEPTKQALESLWPLVVPGGLVVLDDYGFFPGATRAIEEFFGGDLRIEKSSFTHAPSVVAKR